MSCLGFPTDNITIAELFPYSQTLASVHVLTASLMSEIYRWCGYRITARTS